MEIRYLKYKLKFKRAPNRLDSKMKEGVLLKTNENRLMDYMPWEEFGDMSLEKFLNNIAKGIIPDFVTETFNIDAFDLQEVEFLNHSFYPDDSSPLVKIKYLGDMDKLFESLDNISGKARIDFNLGLSLDDWELFLDKVDSSKIDFVEDPLNIFKNIFDKVPIAADFGKHLDVNQIKVYKPLRENKVDAKRVIFSHSMGHPVGVYLSYCHFVQSAKHREEYHGLLAPDIYEDYPSIYLKKENNRYTIDKKQIVNILNELECEAWKPLI